ncbi:MAG: hypothetical protein O7J95_15055 [Planctomycetota bacterium]|nr:hypothetical protein [Planctomycetota bacterium]
MRQNLIIALLSVCATLLAVLVLQPRQEVPVAFGQVAAGNVLMTGSNTQNEAFCFIYDVAAKKLFSYKNRSTGGLELMGVRYCVHDFNPKIEEYPRSNGRTAVRKMKELVEKLKRTP